MVSPTVIGIAGRKRSGKSTIANILSTHYGYTKHSFAEPLKQSICSIFGFTDKQIENDSKEVIDERWNLTPRTVMQVVGTDLFRNTLPSLLPSLTSIWIQSLQHRIENEKDKGEGKGEGTTNIVISDVRFPDEIEFIHSIGGKVWFVNRPNLVNDDDETVHSSEQLMQQYCDVVIPNYGTIAELEQTVEVLVLESTKS